jgi:hypothetical protein
MLIVDLREPKAMYVLVDIDNIPEKLKKQGLRGMIDRFADLALPHAAGSGDARLDVKLYGGWFERSTLTKDAQALSVEIQERFPAMRTYSSVLPAKRVTINVRLAYSLESLPRKELTNTFRWRSPSRKMTCADPRRSGCSAGDCPLLPVMGFVNKNTCPEPECSVTPQHIFKAAGQQKLVDTMLVSDIIFLARTDPMLVVVTNDDDIWPGLISAMVLGATIVHVNSEAGLGAADYRRDVPGRYVQLRL